MLEEVRFQRDEVGLTTLDRGRRVLVARLGNATLATFQFLYAWNSFIWPLVVIDAGNTESFVLTLALSILGGKGGGGRPDLAQAGGPDGAKADAALTAIAEQLGSGGESEPAPAASKRAGQA